MKSLSQRVMANFITRMTYMQQSKGFYTWCEASKKLNARRRMLMFVTNHTQRISVTSAWNRWAENSFKIEQTRLAKELLQK